MGFEFKDRTVEVEICGKIYKTEQGNSRINDELGDLKTNLEALGAERLANDRKACQRMSEQCRGYVSALFGKEAHDEIFSDREPNLLEELRLVAYIHSELNKKVQVEELEDILKEFDL